MANLIPNTLNPRGSDCTGTDATKNRTYTINDSGILAAGLDVVINGTYLHLGTDYTFSTDTITFLNIVDNGDYIKLNYFTQASAGSGTLSYSGPLSLTMFMGLLGTVPSKDVTTRDNIGTGDGSTLVYWFDKLGVIEDSYTISYGDSESSLTALTETTHYVVDLDLSKVTLTGTGRTAVSGKIIYAEYKYNTAELLNSDLTLVLSTAEDHVRRTTEVTFAEFTTASPTYKQITGELKKGQQVPLDKVYDLFHTPIVKIQTTVDGAFTLGDTTLTLTSGTGLPNTGTIYIGGNKVAYTGKSTNDLTVPNTTPTIADDAVVRGEVVELSMEPEGSAPSYTVLEPDVDYEIDYDNGRILILANGYWTEISSDTRLFASNHLIRIAYMHAWHELSRNPEIPDDIEWVVNAIAMRRLKGAIMGKSIVQGMDGFNPSIFNYSRESIREVLVRYQTLNVGTSMYNKQSIS